MKHDDACPNCLHRDNPPRHQTAIPNGTRATYWCARCPHTWTTYWNDPTDAADPDGWEPHTAFDRRS